MLILRKPRNRKKKLNQSPEAKMRRALKSFYYLFFRKFKDASKESKIKTLKFYAQKKFRILTNEQHESRRKKFNKKLSNINTILKYNVKKGVVFIVKCKVCKENDSYVRHHIIQLQHGGNNGRKNQIALCKNCHNAIHPWLN